jgi:predicted secreted hydrolase
MRWLIPLVFLLAGCAPQLEELPAVPSPYSWGPQAVNLEWWYVSSYLPQAQIAFHWAFFKLVPPPALKIHGIPADLLHPSPIYLSQLEVTNLKTGTVRFEECDSFQGCPAQVSYPPLELAQNGWQLRQVGSHFLFRAGPIEARLTPLKPPVVELPGYSGTQATGRMAYISYPRLLLVGKIHGQWVRGLAWMDHQWGNQQPGASATWDWFGLHLSNGADLMLYEIRDAQGQVVQTIGDLTDGEGEVHPLKDLRMVPTATWRSPTGRLYPVAWEIRASGLRLRLQPLHLDQELLSPIAEVAYWEGPEAGRGTYQGEPVQAWGMGEFVAGAYRGS